MEKLDKKKNIVIMMLLVSVVFMAVGYSALAQVLVINGTSNITADWDVAITGIAEGTLDGATTNGTLSYTDTSATFAVDLAYPGASATYTITVENKGSIDAVLNSITGVDTANTAEPTEIQYEVTGVEVNDSLNAGSKATVTVKVTWVSAGEYNDTIPEVTSKTATINLNYVQNT